MKYPNNRAYESQYKYYTICCIILNLYCLVLLSICSIKILIKTEIQIWTFNKLQIWNLSLLVLPPKRTIRDKMIHSRLRRSRLAPLIAMRLPGNLAPKRKFRWVLNLSIQLLLKDKIHNLRNKNLNQSLVAEGSNLQVPPIKREFHNSIFRGWTRITRLWEHWVRVTSQGLDSTDPIWLMSFLQSKSPNYLQCPSIKHKL